MVAVSRTSVSKVIVSGDEVMGAAVRGESM